MKLVKLFCISTLMVFASSVYAEPAEVQRVDDQTWVGFDAEGTTLMYISYQKVETNSDTGEVKYSIHGYLDETAVLPDKAVHYETGAFGYTCTGDAPYFQYVLTPKGRVSEKCQNWPFED